MNLNCKSKNKIIDLWQTPTSISHMCYSNNDGGWQGVLYRYKEWVKGHLNGVWESSAALEAMRGQVSEHFADLDEAAKENEELEFWVM
jgi:hypothetical protein